MKFGIDLGTTNSAICKMEGGEPVVKKTDTLKDTLPSCVSFTKKRVTKVGDSAYNDLRQAESRATKQTWVPTSGASVRTWMPPTPLNNSRPKSSKP